MTKQADEIPLRGPVKKSEIMAENMARALRRQAAAGEPATLTALCRAAGVKPTTRMRDIAAELGLGHVIEK